MKTTRLGLPLLLVLTACASTPPATPPAPGANAPAPARTVRAPAARAVAALAPASGSLVSGRLMLMPMGGGVHITGEVGGLAPNSTHGIHVHETGDCSAVDASSAGPHFNPAARPHGRPGSGAHHAGDLPNITADARGVARVDAHVNGLALGGANTGDVLDRALVVHASADDYASQPAGNSGARVACGVIRAQP